MSRVVAFFALVFGVLDLAGALERDEAELLLNRASLGATESGVSALLGLSREQAVESLLSAALAPSPPLSASRTCGPVFAKPDVAKADRKNEKERFGAFQAEWLAELIAPSAGLRERLVVFWHNHFTSSFETVKSTTDPDCMNLTRHT